MKMVNPASRASRVGTLREYAYLGSIFSRVEPAHQLSTPGFDHSEIRIVRRRVGIKSVADWKEGPCVFGL